jgi:hypothetical protein
LIGSRQWNRPVFNQLIRTSRERIERASRHREYRLSLLEGMSDRVHRPALLTSLDDDETIGKSADETISF